MPSKKSTRPTLDLSRVSANRDRARVKLADGKTYQVMDGSEFTIRVLADLQAASAKIQQPDIVASAAAMHEVIRLWLYEPVPDELLQNMSIEDMERLIVFFGEVQAGTTPTETQPTGD